MKNIKDQKYPEQVSHLRENYGFSQAHANALVMFTLGSKSSQKFESLAEYHKSIPATQSKTIKTLFKIIKEKYPDLESVVAWNQPMLKRDSKYIFGVSVTKNYLLIAPWNAEVLDSMRSELDGYIVNKKTIQVPSDWEIDKKLILKLVKATLAK